MAGVKGIDRTNDYAFKRIFGSEDTKDILLSFLNAILKPGSGEELADLTLADRELDPERLKDRELRLDIRATTASGEIIDLEVQVVNHHDIDRRTLYHWARLFYGQLREGGRFKDLRRTIAVDVLKFDWFAKDQRYHHVFHVREDESGEMLCKHLECHLLEIPKFKNLSRPPINTLEKWLVYLGNVEGESMKTIAEEEPAIQHALTIEEIFWQDEKERRYYEMRQDGLLDYRSELSAVREESLKEGREDNKKETAKAALEEGSSVEFVVKITGLSRETVLKLKSDMEKEQ